MDILREILTALESEQHIMLATIISTTGSTPASALSKMMVSAGGEKWAGTVGGGCMEGDVLQEAIRFYGTGTARILTFHLNETNIDQGLICGGSVDILIEPISRSDLPLIKELKSLRDDGSDCIIATFISNDGRATTKHCITTSSDWNDGTIEWDRHLPHTPQSPIDPEAGNLQDIARKVYRHNETKRIKTEIGEWILEPLNGTPSLIIFGGGHVSKYISRAAAMSGFHVTVVDDRPEYANVQRFPEAFKTMAEDFHEALQHIEIKSSTYIVIVTRGHRSDEEILERVISSPAKYIGMIGSQRKVLTTYEHLAKKGISVQLMERVHAPIGIEIGATTAEEIGISVVAQLIAVRRGEVNKQKNKSDVMITQISRIEL